MTTWTWWRSAVERAVRTVAQTLLAVIGVAAVGTAGLEDVDWWRVLSISALSGILSLVTSVATEQVTGDGPGLTETPARRAVEEG